MDIIYAYAWNLHHYTGMLLHYLCKTNVLTRQGVYKAAICGRLQSILNHFPFLLSKDCTLSCHIFIHYTSISYILLNLHMTIQILTLLMMFMKKFIYVFYPFLNQTIGNMVHTSYVDTIYACG